MIIRFIIEIMGKPPSIIEKTLRGVVDSFSNRYEVVSTDYSEAEEVKASSLFSAFVEIEFKVKDFEGLFSAVIDYGPTIIEVIEPSMINVSSTELQASLSDLVSKFHSMSKALQMLKLENLKLKKEAGTTQ